MYKIEVLKDLYIKKTEKNKINYFNGFINEQLKYSITMKNLERSIFLNKIKKNRILERKQIKDNNTANMSQKILLKNYKLRKKLKNILKYFLNLTSYYYQI